MSIHAPGGRWTRQAAPLTAAEFERLKCNLRAGIMPTRAEVESLIRYAEEYAAALSQRLSREASA